MYPNVVWALVVLAIILLVLWAVGVIG